MRLLWPQKATPIKHTPKVDGFRTFNIMSNVFTLLGRKRYLQEMLWGNCGLFLQIAINVLFQAERKHRAQHSDVTANLVSALPFQRLLSTWIV